MKRPALLRSTAVFSAMTLLSRLAGFARDVLQANLFGVSAATDAFVVAYRIPNYLRRIFAEGSFASAFVPAYSAIKDQADREAVRDFLDHVAGALCAAVLVVAALGMLAAPWLAAVFAPGALAQAGQVALIADMLRITFPYLVFISLTALAGAVLNSHGRFGLAALTPVLHNVAMITAMLALAPLFEVPPMALAWGVLLAGVLQFALLWPALGRLGIRPRFRLDLRHPAVRRVGGLMLPTLFSSSVAQLNLIVGTVFASLVAQGSQTWLYNADRLSEFPLGLFGVAIGTVILPHLAARHAAADAEGYARAIDWGLRMVMLVGLPAGVGLLMLAEPLAAAMFQHGAFTAEDARMTGLALSATAIAVPAFMLTKVLLSAFYSRQDTRTPMRAAVATVLLNVVLIAAITTPLWKLGVPGAHAGIALATALAGIANAALLWRWLHRGGAYRSQPGWAAYLLRLVLASLAMALALGALRAWLGDFTAMPLWPRIGAVLGCVAAGAAVYGLVLLALGVRPRQVWAH
ncbi:MAG: murein biosynthesis integral membrane protein MurJ [Silanimonas lenta]